MSIELGKFNQLEVVKQVDFGMYLDGGEEGEILLPTRYVPEDCKLGDWLNVFLYLDNGTSRGVCLPGSIVGQPVRSFS